MRCRSCTSPLEFEVLNLGFAPPSNAYLEKSGLDESEVHLPLKVLVCESCWLLQTSDFLTPEDLFTDDYAYLSSTSTSWLKHAEKYANDISEKLGLCKNSFVVEIASNDGYLLHFFNELSIPNLGIEPTVGTAKISQGKGINTLCAFFGKNLAIDLIEKGPKADLIIGNNVFAHVPDLNDFTKGLSILLSSKGTITLEFPHVLNLVEQNQFDTVYHEHFSYLSAGSTSAVLGKHGLEIYDIELLPTHGGSLRVFAAHKGVFEVSQRVTDLLTQEQAAGLYSLPRLQKLQSAAIKSKHSLLQFLLDAKSNEKVVIGIGAAAKGNTFLNFAGVTQDLLPFVVDGARSKQGKLLPGSHIPIISPEAIENLIVDIALILPWNLKDELYGIYSQILGRDVEFFDTSRFLSEGIDK
jgi:hypothetical protein